MLEYLEDIKSDFSAFHHVDDIYETTAQWSIPKMRRLHSYKGALRFSLEQEAEKRNPSRGSGAVVYDDPKKNQEAQIGGIFEAGVG